MTKYNKEESAGRYSYSSYYGAFTERLNLFGSMPDYDFESDLSDTDDENNYPDTPVDGMWSGFTPSQISSSIVLENDVEEDENDLVESNDINRMVDEESAAPSRSPTPQNNSSLIQDLENEESGMYSSTSSNIGREGFIRDSGQWNSEQIDEIVDQDEEKSFIDHLDIEIRGCEAVSMKEPKISEGIALEDSTASETNYEAPSLSPIIVSKEPIKNPQRNDPQTKPRLSPISTRFREPRRHPRLGGRIPVRDLIYGRQVPTMLPVVSAVNHVIDVALTRLSSKKISYREGAEHGLEVIDLQHPSYTVALTASQLALARIPTPTTNNQLTRRPLRTRSYREKRSSLLGLAGDLMDSASRRL